MIYGMWSWTCFFLFLLLLLLCSVGSCETLFSNNPELLSLMLDRAVPAGKLRWRMSILSKSADTGESRTSKTDDWLTGVNVTQFFTRRLNGSTFLSLLLLLRPSSGSFRSSDFCWLPPRLAGQKFLPPNNPLVGLLWLFSS